MLWKRYSLSLALAILFLLLESCKPDAQVYMPTVTNTHVTKNTDNETQTSPVLERTQVAGVVTSSTGLANYPLHRNILATVFWVGEDASPDNGFIANHDSAWDTSWVEHFGGVDYPTARNGFKPAGFTPNENPFYCALPFGDYTATGPKPTEELRKIYWYEPFSEGESLLKNRWIRVMKNGKVSYCQWEDVGPFEENDVDYVFGSAQPKQEVGLDVSPAVRDYLGLNGKSRVSWQFVNSSQVPNGPWKEIITSRSPDW